MSASRASIRAFSTTVVRAFDNEAKYTAAKVLPNHADAQISSGNSFKTFAEYRLRAIQRGPLTGVKIKPLDPVVAAAAYGGLPAEFVRAARRKDYNDWEN